MSTALDRIDPVGALTEKPWIDQIDERQLALIQNTVAKGLTKAEVGQFLEIARSLGMNPWANEIWAAKGKGKDGGEGKLLLMVGRDGLIGHAERNFADYMGYESGVVYSGDTFERGEPDPEARSMRGRAGVVHEQAKPHDGDLLGAWAVCERSHRPPRFFYAALDEYMPTNENQRKYSPWGSATAAMIEKVPISIVHRTLCGLGAVYLEEEVARAFDAESTVVVDTRESLLDAILDNIPRELQDRGRELIDEQNSLAANSWTASKVEMVFSGKSSYMVSAELAAIERAIEELASRPLQELPDAEVVPEPLRVGDPVEEEATPEMLETAERVRRARVEDLEEALAGDGLSEQQRSDAEAELDLLTSQGEQDSLPL